MLKTKLVSFVLSMVEFNQRVTHHLRGQKCKKCSLESRTNTREEFIDKSNKVHGAFYNYDKIKSEFVKRTDKVDIICQEHAIIDEFEYLKVWTKLKYWYHPKSILGNQYTHETIWY